MLERPGGRLSLTFKPESSVLYIDDADAARQYRCWGVTSAEWSGASCCLTIAPATLGASPAEAMGEMAAKVAVAAFARMGTLYRDLNDDSVLLRSL